MKIRYDFVSNSSSSSFVVFGIELDEEQTNTFLESKVVLDFLKAKWDKEKPDYYDSFEDFVEDERIYCLSEMFEGFSIHTSGYDGDIDGLAIGINPNKIDENKTINEAKEDVCRKLIDYGFKCESKDVRFISGGSDGQCLDFIGSCG